MTPIRSNLKGQGGQYVFPENKVLPGEKVRPMPPDQIYSADDASLFIHVEKGNRKKKEVKMEIAAKPAAK